MAVLDLPEEPRQRALSSSSSSSFHPLIKAVIATVLTVALVEVAGRAVDVFRDPAPLFLLMTVVYVALIGGTALALLCSAAIVLYACYFFSAGSGGWFSYEIGDMLKLLSLAVVAPSMAVLVGLLKERTDRLSNRALRRARDYSASLLAAMQDGLIARDANGAIVDVNESFQRMSGFGRDELIGSTPPYPFWASDAIEANRKVYQRFMGGEAGEFEMAFQRNDGRAFPVILSVAPTQAYHQGQRIFVSTVKDISERREEERRLAESQKLNLAVLNSLPAHIAVLDRDGRITAVNAAWTRFAAENHASAGAAGVGVNYLDACARSNGAGGADPLAHDAAEAIRSVLRGDTPLATMEYPCHSPTEQRWFLMSVVPLSAPNASGNGNGGAGGGAVVAHHDITDRRRSEETVRQRAVELAQMTRALKRSNEELDQFAYITSHDLKAPLRGIANLATWIEEDIGDRFTPEVRQQMELLRGRVHRMESLIDGILEYSRIGRVTGKVEEVDVAKLLADVTDLLDPPTSVTIEVAAGMPTIRADRLRLQQVFMNLIGNAIKHGTSPDGGGGGGGGGAQQGHVKVWVSAREADADRWEFTVADNGPGIAKQYHEKIFVIFQTLQSRDRKESTGVGLSLVKKIVEHFGGTVRVESEEGRGARFIFTWPKDPTKGVA